MTPSELIPRSDNVGLLVRRLCGDDETPPDLTAAAPLLDELTAIQPALAENLLDTLLRAEEMLTTAVDRAMDRESVLRDVARELRRTLLVYLYDASSVCVRLCSLADALAKPVEAKAGTVALNTLRFESPYEVAVGERVRLPNGATGICVRARDADGMIDAVPVEGDYTNAPDSMPMMVPPMRRIGRR